MNKKNLIIQQSTELTLQKATNLMSITNKILKNSKKELVANPDIMIIDGKMWQKKTIEEKMTWDEAMEYAKNLRLGGYDDWRLPTIEELKNIIINCGGTPSKFEDEDVETTTKNMNNSNYQSCYKRKGFISSFYWSIIIDIKNYNDAWIVDLEDGYMYKDYKSSFIYVRCIRTEK